MRRSASLPLIAATAAAFALGSFALDGQQRPIGNANHPSTLEQANRVPDANDRMELNEQQVAKVDFENANAARRKELTDESARLLQLAADLKKEMDKTDKDTLSLNVIRKADEIEKLAKEVKAKMRLTVGQG